jgi:hypothetical protein
MDKRAPLCRDEHRTHWLDDLASEKWCTGRQAYRLVYLQEGFAGTGLAAQDDDTIGKTPIKSIFIFYMGPGTVSCSALFSSAVRAPGTFN